jgi:adenine-specific DNA glycosylase
MELGATLCSPTAPRCLACPIARQCATRRDELPVVAPRKRAHELPLLARVALWIQDGDEIVLVRRAPQGLFGGLWELPPLEIAGALGVTEIGEPIAHHEQTLTHRRLRLDVLRAAMPSRLGKPLDPSYDAVIRVELARARRLGIAAATTAILTKYEDTPWSSTPKRSPSSPKATTRSSKASRTSASTPKMRTSSTPASARRRRSTSSSTTRSR